MKREYFGMIFLVVTLILILVAEALFGEIAYDYIAKFIIIWLMIAFYAGQYSMKFPKSF